MFCLQELEFNQGSMYSDEERDAIMRVFSANAPSCGPEVLAFEKEFSSFVGSTHAIAVGNATQGLEIAARATIALWHGDKQPEIIVPSISWISTASAAALAGATVKFADVAPRTLCADIESIKSLVTPLTAAVILVHLYGRPVDGAADLAAWLHSRGIKLIEDCAHAVAAVDASGRMCGTIGDIGVFSFHQQKNMVTLGEGGMCVTSDPKLRELMTGYRSLCAMSYDPKGKYLTLDSQLHPMGLRYWMMVSAIVFYLAVPFEISNMFFHDFADHGSNYRMLDMQAAVGRVQLRKVKEWNARRTEIARALHAGLSQVNGLNLPDVDGCSEGGDIVHAWHVFHVFVTDVFPLPKEQFM
jgi:dTDP-4-amino-4,6-dideoxygalactose transaminase